MEDENCKKNNEFQNLNTNSKTSKYQANHNFDQTNQPPHTTEFWLSQSNIGDKINILIGLNILVVNLLIAIIYDLRCNKELSDNITEELKVIHLYLNQLLEHPESGLELKEKIHDTEKKIDFIFKEFSKVIEHSNGVKIEKESSQKYISIFFRNSTYTDKWGLIESIESILISYSNLSHLSFPSYYLTACKELLHYEIQKEHSHTNHQEIFQIPTFKIKTLISKLLREAPTARLLQNLRRLYPNDDETYLTSSDMNIIKDIVQRYFIELSEFFNGKRNLQDSIHASSGILESYNLGAGDLESRIPNISFTIIKEIHNELQQDFNSELRQFILSETIILINRLNDSLLQNERFVTYLRRLK